jgi:hypothetical protein
MSNINVTAQGRALPFTGLSVLPLVLLGSIVSLVGGVIAIVRPQRTSRTQ